MEGCVTIAVTDQGIGVGLQQVLNDLLLSCYDSKVKGGLEEEGEDDEEMTIPTAACIQLYTHVLHVHCTIHLHMYIHAVFMYAQKIITSRMGYCKKIVGASLSK